MSHEQKNSPPALAEHCVPSRAEKTRAGAEAGSSKRHFYKPLRNEFPRDGFEYRQLAREGDTAIYAQTWCGCPAPSVCYEVVRIRRRDGFNIDGRIVEPAELYPPPEAWGVDGFTLTDKDSAFAKFRELAKANAALSRVEVKE